MTKAEERRALLQNAQGTNKAQERRKMLGATTQPNIASELANVTSIRTTAQAKPTFKTLAEAQAYAKANNINAVNTGVKIPTLVQDTNKIQVPSAAQVLRDNYGSQLGKNITSGVASGLTSTYDYFKGLGNELEYKLKSQKAMTDALTSSMFGKSDKEITEELKANLQDIETNKQAEIEADRAKTQWARDYQQEVAEGNQNYKGLSKGLLNATNVASRMYSTAPLGTYGIFANSAGGAYNQAMDAGADSQKALAYATTSGALETGVETLSGGVAQKLLNVPAVGKISNLTEKIKNPFLRGVANVAGDVLGEGGEEVITALLDPYIQKATYNPNAGFASWSEAMTDAGNAFVESILPTLLMGGTSYVVDGVNSFTNKQIEKIQSSNLSQNEKQQLINQVQQQGEQIIAEQQKNIAPESAQMQETTATNEVIPQEGVNANIANVAQNTANVQNVAQNEANLTQKAIDLVQNSRISQSDKKSLIDTIKNMQVTEASFENLQNLIQTAESKIPQPYVNKTKLEQQKYAQYKNNPATYDVSFDEILEANPANKQGKRTKQQWLKVAEDFGKRLQGKTAEEIELNQYKTWQAARPNTKDTLNRYGSAKQGDGTAKYVSFTLDEWKDAIARGANQQNQNNTQVQQSLGIDQQKTQVPAEIQTFIDNRNRTSPGLRVEMDSTINTDGVIIKNSDGTRTMRINPRSTRAYEFVAVHEMLHDLENTEAYRELAKFVNDRALTQEGFEKAKAAITEQYQRYYTENGLDMSKLNMEAETTNDMIAQALGNQEFLNELAGQKPTVFMRIYDWFKNVLFDGRSTGKTFSERRADNKFLQELKKKFEIAYNTAYQGVTTEQTDFSIGGIKGVQNAAQNNVAFKRLEDNLKRAQHMARNGASNEFIRQNTNWFQDKKGDWKFEFSDKDMKLKKNKNLIENRPYQLKDILQHDTLFLLYPELANCTVTREPLSKNKKGSFIGKTNSIKINSNLKKRIEIEGTLIHEIQHAIQKIEGFSRGRSAKWSKLAYFNSLGETEANDTKRRMIQEKKGVLDREATPPESSKANPKHSMLDKYLQNRTLSDKIKDGIYKYLSDRGVINDSTIEENTAKDRGQNLDLVVERGRLEELEESSSFSLGENTPATDNKGRELTKEQQEYFRDSKVRDEEGRLLEVYHGTDEDFTVFDLSYLGTANDLGFLGDGFYFATHKGEAQYYGSKIMAGYLDVRNPFNIQELFTHNGKRLSGGDTNSYLQIYNLLKLNQDWANIEIGNSTFGEIGKMVKHFLDNVDIKKSGIIEDEYGNDNGIMWNISINGKTKQVKSVLNYTQDSMLADALHEYLRSRAGYIAGSEVLQRITEEKRFDKNVKTFREVLQEKGYDGVIQGNFETTDEIVVFNSNQFKNVDNTNPTENPDIRYSQSNDQPNDEWAKYLSENWDLMANARKAPTLRQQQAEQEAKRMNLKKPKLEEIAELTAENVQLPKGSYKQKADETPTYRRKFWDNVESSKIIGQNIKDQVNMTNYERKTNEDTLNKMKERLDADPVSLTKMWWAKGVKKATDQDIALGAILLERYQQEGRFDEAVDVVQKLADIGTEAGRTVQMYSIFQRLTPEGMQIYQQRKLNSALENITKKQTGKWVEENKDKFKLTQDDATFITAKVQEAQNAPTERQKQIALAEIEKRINDKLPPEAGQSVKAFRRIAMLFNPKTQVRNVVGNTTVMPLNYVSDLVATSIDKAIAKKTGVRTTTLPSAKTMLQGAKKGLAETWDDYRRGIRTTPTGTKYEIQNNVKSFNENTGNKAVDWVNNKLNGIDRILSSVMEAGDRPFYEAAYQNSLQGQMKANGVTEPTQDMIDIASNVALSQTWQDSNNYTQAVLGIRSAFNKINIHGFGLGDLIIPFAKTPANLTKAMVEYSPAGLIPTIINYNDMRKAISRGDMTPMQQKKFVTSVGKAAAGTLLYVLANSLVQSGAITGSSDEDKDVANFEKNVLGIQPYSIRIDDKTYTYNWAQPLAAPLAIMADAHKMSEEGAELNDILLNAIKVGGDQLVANSFLQGIQELLSSQYSNESMMDNLVGAIMDLPTQFTPTLLGQIATYTDATKRQTYENGDAVGTMVNEVKNKIPGKKETLAPQVNTFGEEILNYGGDNSAFNVFLNPGNISSANATDAQKELYKLYQDTKDKTIFPAQAPYSVSGTVDGNGVSVKLSSHDRAEYQKTSGKYVSENLDKLFDSEYYKTLDNEKKAEVVNALVSDANTLAKGEFLETKASKELKEKLAKLGNISVIDYYNAWSATRDIKSDKNWKGESISGSKKKKQIEAINNAVSKDLTKKQKETLYGILNVSGY